VPVQYYLFDVLWADGTDVRPQPLRERKQRLHQLLDFADPLRFTEHRVGDGVEFYQEACQQGWEGLIAKRADAPYVGGRTKDWLKFKCENNQEFVIGGYTDPQGSRTGLGALLLGVYDRDGQLVYAGKVGTGFDQQTLHRLHDELSALEQDKSPFDRGTRPGPECTGPAPAGRADRLQRVDHGRAVAPPEVPGTAPGQEPGRRDPGGSAGSWLAPQPAKQVKVGRLTVALTNTSKVLFPADGITKGDLIGYYQAAAEQILPYLRDRPVAMARYPDGITGERIFQKNVGRHFPDWIPRVEVGKQGGQLCQVVCTKAADLVYLANQAAIELPPVPEPGRAAESGRAQPAGPAAPARHADLRSRPARHRALRGGPHRRAAAKGDPRG